MNFAFVHMSDFNETPYAGWMVDSIRKHMPDADITQVSDKNCLGILGSDRVYRYDFEYGFTTFPKIWFYTMLNIGKSPIAYVDCDAIFTGSVEHLLDDDFDVTAALRDYDDGTGPKLKKVSPYNTGFFVVKNPAFWKRCHEEIRKISGSSFSLGQQVYGKMIDSGEFNVKFIPGSVYNRSPANVWDFDEKALVWHFKGSRKKWMQEWQTAHIR